MNRLNKKELLDNLIYQLERKAKIMTTAAEGARQDSINAEGRMQTRYGSEKEESGYLADGFNLRKSEIKEGIARLEKFQLPENPDKIVNGVFVQVKENGDFDNYFILPYGGGETLKTEKREVTVLSPISPIAKAMLNKRIGESFDFGRGNYTIEGIL